MKSIYNNFENRFLSLKDLSLGELPAELEFEGDRYLIKPEFHITLLAAGQIADMVGGDLEKMKSQIVKDFEEFTESFDLDNYELTDELRLCDVGGNKTVIVMVKLQGIEKLFEYLSGKYSINLPVQPTHITLYTLPTDTFGIPILSYEELERISKLINIPEIIEKLQLTN